MLFALMVFVPVPRFTVMTAAAEPLARPDDMMKSVAVIVLVGASVRVVVALLVAPVKSPTRKALTVAVNDDRADMLTVVMLPKEVLLGAGNVPGNAACPT